MRPIVLRIVLAGLTLAAAPPVRADEAAADRKALRACLAKAKDNERSCIGTIADPCQNEPEGSTTPGIAECFGREEAVWDAILNERYGTALAAAKETDARLRGPDASPVPVEDALRKAQRAWVAFRDAECERIFALNQDGTIRVPATAACTRDLTAERAIALAPEER